MARSTLVMLPGLLNTRRLFERQIADLADIADVIVPELWHRDTMGAIAQDILLLCWTANQTLAWLGVVTAGAAYLFWSLDLLRGPRPAARLVGVAGLAAGALPTILLVTGVLSLNVTGAAILYAGQVAWGALVGLLMLAEAAPKRPADGVAP